MTGALLPLMAVSKGFSVLVAQLIDPQHIPAFVLLLDHYKALFIYAMLSNHHQFSKTVFMNLPVMGNKLFHCCSRLTYTI